MAVERDLELRGERAALCCGQARGDQYLFEVPAQFGGKFHDRAGQHSIRINRQWRICFVWTTEVPTVSKSSTTTRQIPNPTPGEVLLLEFIEPIGLTQNGLARAIGVPPRRINEIVLGKRSITADTDLRLARYFGVSEGFWLGLQADHDLLRPRREIDAGDDFE